MVWDGLAGIARVPQRKGLDDSHAKTIVYANDDLVPIVSPCKRSTQPGRRIFVAASYGISSPNVAPFVKLPISSIRWAS